MPVFDGLQLTLKFDPDQYTSLSNRLNQVLRKLDSISQGIATLISHEDDPEKIKALTAQLKASNDALKSELESATPNVSPTT